MGLVGNTDRDVRKFLREVGMKPNAENVDRIGRELRRTSQENERVERIAREGGRGGIRDPHLPGSPDTTGPVEDRVKHDVAREQRRRDRRR